MITYLNSLNYNKEVTLNKKRVILLFTASWCLACNEILPKYEQWAKRYSNKLEFKIVDMHKNKRIVKKYDVASSLTFLIIENKTVINRFAGMQTDETFDYFINRK